MNRTPAIVAALGHAWLSDEAFGLRVLEAVRRHALPPDVEVADWSFGTITAFQRLTARPYQTAVFLSAVTRGRRPGVLYQHRADAPLRSAAEIHARVADSAMGLVSLDNLLIMARFYDLLPAQVLVLETEPVEDGWGDELSPTVQALVPQAVACVLAELSST